MSDAVTYNIEIKGLEKLINKLSASVREDVIKLSLFQGGWTLAGWSKANRLSGPRPQYLGVVTGRLRSSIAATETEHIGNTYITRIGTNVEYAHRHEYGTFGMPARPFLRPALKDEGNRAEVLNILTENINEALERG